MQHTAFAPVVALAVAIATVGWLTRSRFAQLAVDRPNERSLHDKPVPRTGGLGLHAGVFLAWPLTWVEAPAVLWVAFAGLLIVSLMDDIRGLPVLARLAAHLLASGSVATFLLLPEHGLMAACIATLGITWLINLYNFMDGADGLAGGMAFFGFGFYGIAAWLAGSSGFAWFNFSIAAAAAGFLLFNFHPARIFMGDSGSIPLGFLAGAMGLIGWVQNDWPWWFPILVFSPFIVDASLTLARRLFQRARIWQAHRDHYYQRLVQLGWGHRRTALAEYALMALCGIAALASLHWSPSAQIALLLTAALLYIFIISLIETAWRKHLATQKHET